MIDKEALRELAKADTIRAANAETGYAQLALPNDFSLHDLEKLMPMRRRARGCMKTSSIGDFAAYAASRRGDSGTSAVFVDQDAMSATAVLNMGTLDFPGHADDVAVLAPKVTAAYAALLAIAGGKAAGQKQVAEWIEDWDMHLTCADDRGGFVANGRAAAAVRSITIEGLRRVQSEEQNLSVSKGVLEQVAAKDTDFLPVRMVFATEPYYGLQRREFSVRLGIVTGDKPALTLRIVKVEQHAEEMAQELAQLVRDAIGSAMPVHLGTYQPKP